MTARNQERVLDEIAQAKRRFGLPETAAVVSGYEAGREGFWLHRFLLAHGITNHVVDSSAIEVSRQLPGLPSTPSDRWGRLLRTFPLTSTDA